MPYYRIKPLEVFAIGEKMQRMTGSIPYMSLQWNRRYQKPGDFSMTVPVDIYDPGWAYIYSDDRPEMGIIQKVEYSDSSETYGGRDSVTVSGFFLESILNRITFLVEQPETMKVEIPAPKRPSYKKSANPEIYADPVGGWYYKDDNGDIVSVDDGRTVSETGLTKVNYTSAFGNATYPGSDETLCNFNYYTNGSEDTIHVTRWDGTDEEFDVEFSDGNGNVFYRDGNTLKQAVGVVENKGETYWVRKRAWSGTGGYKEVTVKGPWQRTEALEPITEGDSIQIVMKWCQRMMGNWIIYEEPEITGIQKKVDPSLQYLGDLLYSTLYEVGASFRLEYLFEKNAYILSIYKGLDRTQSQDGNPWAVFSDTWGTLHGYKASRDESNYKNTCYVLYDYDVPNSFNSDGSPHVVTVTNKEWDDSGYISYTASVTAYIPYTTKRGYYTETVTMEEGEPVQETYLDLRDDKPSCDNLWSRDSVTVSVSDDVSVDQARAQAIAQCLSTSSEDYVTDMRSIYTAYEENLHTQGVDNLEQNYGVITNLETGVIETFNYMTDFDLGDVVDMQVNTIGLVKEARIIEVSEAYEATEGSTPTSNVSITIGDEELTMIKKARLV